MSDRTYSVQIGVRKREPHLPVRIVGEDGTAFHVIEADRATTAGLPRLPLHEAIDDALRRAGLGRG